MSVMAAALSLLDTMAVRPDCHRALQLFNFRCLEGAAATIDFACELPEPAQQLCNVPSEKIARVGHNELIAKGAVNTSE
jgi:hypothetical protein